MKNSSYNPGLHRFAVFTACWTLFLLVAGALVTSNDAGLAVPDWPLSYGSLMPPMVGGIFYEHGHRMVATAAGIFTIILAVWISRRETRASMRRLGWSALAAVVAQGILGGITVKFFLPPWVSVAHAALAQAFFCSLVAIALFTSKWWQSELQVVRYSAHPPVRERAVAAAIVIFIQLLLGAAYRHQALGILPHLIGAVIVPFVVLPAAFSSRDRAYGSASGLARCGTMLKHVLYVQLALGGAALWSRLATQHAPQPMPVMVFFTVAHTAVGALTLAVAVLLVLVAFRVLGPVRPEKVAASQPRMAGQEGGAL
ncbi:MAG: COX15/CtaA family protein [Acidobacteria bacterium]|nr:COX15/CtaA family protein [Acidobacteriota bacterium]MCL5288889.1 COX15/CtaA family protein [Acidobacteriota bacterium]